MKVQTKRGFSLILILIAAGVMALALIILYSAFNKGELSVNSVIPGKTLPVSKPLSKTDKISDIDTDLDATTFTKIDASLKELETGL